MWGNDQVTIVKGAGYNKHVTTLHPVVAANITDLSTAWSVSLCDNFNNSPTFLEVFC